MTALKEEAFTQKCHKCAPFLSTIHILTPPPKMPDCSRSLVPAYDGSCYFHAHFHDNSLQKTKVILGGELINLIQIQQLGVIEAASIHHVSQ